jgi:hypothetical protein
MSAHGDLTYYQRISIWAFPRIDKLIRGFEDERHGRITFSGRVPVSRSAASDGVE